MLPQYAEFISRFFNLVSETGINVVSDVANNLSIEVPNNITDNEVSKIAKKVNVLDALISKHSESISDLFKKGLDIEQGLKNKNPQYVSQLTDQLDKYNKLKLSYKH